MPKSRKLVVGWHGLPAYAARLIRRGQINCAFDFQVLGTRPDVPIKGMESILGKTLKWIDADIEHTWSELGLEIPDIFIHTSWCYQHFNSLAKEVRANGGQVIGMFDNCWKRNLRQIIGGIYFRFVLLKRFNAAWVPGKSGRKFARYLGFKKKQIFEGMYGADPEIFKCIVPINQRPQRIIFVGRLIHRKGIMELVNAFSNICEEFHNWELLIVGEGKLLEQVKTFRNVKCLPFMQPEKVAKLMNESKIFVLPSREEHWGVVVHEAALCGCALLLQSNIGALYDLANNNNSEVFDKTTTKAIEAALVKIISWDNKKFN